MFYSHSLNNNINQAVNRYDQQLALEQKKTTAGLIASIFIVVGAVFLTLAAHQILPYGVNSISNLGMAGYVISYSTLAFGLIFTLIFAIRKYLNERTRNQTVQECLKSVEGEKTFASKVEKLSQAAALTYSRKEGHEELSAAYLRLKKQEASLEEMNSAYLLGVEIAESAYAAGKYPLVVETLASVAQQTALDEKTLTLWMLSLIELKSFSRLQKELADLPPFSFSSLYTFLVHNSSFYEKQSAVATLFAFLGEQFCNSKNYAEAIACFEQAEKQDVLSPNHKVLLSHCYLKEEYSLEELEACVENITSAVEKPYQSALAAVYFHLAEKYSTKQKSRWRSWSSVSTFFWGTSSLSVEANKASNYYFSALSFSDHSLLHEKFLSFIDDLRSLPEEEFHSLQENCYTLGKEALKQEKWTLAAYYFLSATLNHATEKKVCSKYTQEGMLSFLQALPNLEKDASYGELLTKALEFFEISPIKVTTIYFQGEWGQEKIYDHHDVKIKGRLHLLRAEFFEQNHESEKTILNEYILANRWGPKNPLGHEELIDDQEHKSTTQELIQSYKFFANLWNS